MCSPSPYSDIGLSVNNCKKVCNLSFFVYRFHFNIESKLYYENNNYTIFIWKLHKITLRKIDKYRFVVLNENYFLKKNEILYCQCIRDCSDNTKEDGMLWENGLRESTWQCYKEKGILFTEWHKGVRKKTYFRNYMQIEEKRKKLPKL